jgi:two-component system sensor histidine kinase BaeS
MYKSLWFRFLLLLVGVAIVSLSSAFILRDFMLADFREYREGEMEDRVYWVIADLEGTYDKYKGWKEDSIREDLIWALMLGFEVRVLNEDNRVVMSTDKALASLSAQVSDRVIAVFRTRMEQPGGEYIPYPLFLRGREIGRLDVKFLRPKREAAFVDRSNHFLFLALLAMGGIAVVLSIFFARKLTRPIRELAAATRAVAVGELYSRVDASGSTEIRHLSENFNRMAESLELQESLRKKLITNVAHELRTPMGAMQSELESIRDGIVPLTRENVESLLDEIDRLRGVVDGIEQLSQAQASALSLGKETFNLSQYLENVRERLLRSTGDRRIIIDVECDDTISVHADADRLTQVMLNLLSNALKAVDDNGHIVLKGAQSRIETLISVIDNGMGIREEELPFIFERFYSATKGGLGIGLSIVRELVQSHGGHIEVQSEWGKGSAFTVGLPRSRP